MNFEDRVGGQDDTAAVLFAAARAYRPPASTRRRTLRALGLPVGLSLLAPGVVQAAAALASVKSWIVLVGAIASAAGAFTVARVAGERTEGQGSGGPVAVATARRAPAPRSFSDLLQRPGAGGGGAGRRQSSPIAAPRLFVDSPHPNPLPAGGGMRSPPPIPSPTQPRPRPLAMSSVPPLGASTPSRAVVPSPPSADVSSLRAELTLVGAARARLRAGDARGTLAALADYPHRFPAGALAEEVDLLSMRALVAAGDGARARLLGADFLAHHPGSPLSGAVRALLNSPTTRGQEGDER